MLICGTKISSLAPRMDLVSSERLGWGDWGTGYVRVHLGRLERAWWTELLLQFLPPNHPERHARRGASRRDLAVQFHVLWRQLHHSLHKQQRGGGVWGRAVSPFHQHVRAIYITPARRAVLGQPQPCVASQRIHVIRVIRCVAQPDLLRRVVGCGELCRHVSRGTQTDPPRGTQTVPEFGVYGEGLIRPDRLSTSGHPNCSGLVSGRGSSNCFLRSEAPIFPAARRGRGGQAAGAGAQRHGALDALASAALPAAHAWGRGFRNERAFPSMRRMWAWCSSRSMAALASSASRKSSCHSGMSRLLVMTIAPRSYRRRMSS